ncbi:FAD binding domain-containing protein [Pseudonocardia xinjiangensis]|uniref:Xanthine dehydrogenase family protein subunit M n=1 Tax=Pseudonocardia xinjiangensis TaxID=75289 RepID=A0ABX1RCK5_9PSEU|nr:xanthine dehydrogenase family protein subunit M [Pseudonocardia xinjiangensis]NMH77384.1 xanthine dehydrogenase family protein subunit M [Pseudonocardia xinjiangensis]
MIPVAFSYARPDSVDGALALLAEHGEDATILAGGHSLLPVMKLRLGAPEVVIDIGRLPELRYIRVQGDEVAIGAGTRHRDLEASDVLGSDVPLLAAVARTVGDPQVRHRGTIGGSLAHADPASDLPAAVLALDATIVLRSPRGERQVPATGFYTGMFSSVKEPDELIVEIRVPRTGSAGWAYEKFTRRANDWAIVGVAVVDGRVGLVNMGASPLRASATEAALADGASIDEAAALADQGTDPQTDVSATAEYRRHLARLLTRRALTTAAG